MKYQEAAFPALSLLSAVLVAFISGVGTEAQAQAQAQPVSAGGKPAEAQLLKPAILTRLMEPAAPQAQASAELADVIELVRQKDPRVVVSELLTRRALERAARTRATLLPQASLGYDFGRERVDSSVGGAGVSGAKTVRSPSLQVVWGLDLFGATRARVAESLALARSEEAKYRRSWEMVVLETVELYVNFYRLREQLEITRELLLGYTELVRIMDDRFKANMTSSARRNEAILRLREVLDEREEVLTQLKETAQNWRLLTGTEPPDKLVPPVIQRNYRGVEDLNIQEAMAVALQSHPQIEANRHSIEANKQSLKALSADRHPKFSLYATRSNASPSSTAGAFGGATTDSTTRYGIRMEWNFLGSAYGNAVTEQQLAVWQNEAEQERARREVGRNIANTIDVLSGIRDRRALLGETLRLSEEVLEQRLAAFKSQSMSDDAILTLNNAYQSKARAKVTLLNLRCREIAATYTLLENKGQLSQVYPPAAQSFPEVPIRHFLPATR